MSEQPTIEQRLAALETAVRELQNHLHAPIPPWLDKVIGPIQDQEALGEAMEYGRAFRNSDRPSDDPNEPS